MLLTKRTLMIYNVEYEMQDEMGKMVTWKANVLCKEGYADAEAFIRKYAGKPINVLSFGRVTEIDAVTDEVIEYIEKRLGLPTT